MKPKKIIVLIVAFLGLNSFAQKTKIDSLLILLKTDKADTNRLIHLYELSNEFSKIDNYDDGIKYANQAIIFSNVLPGKRDKTIKKTIKIYTAKAYYNLGNINYYKSNYPEAVKNHLIAVKINKEIGNKKSIAASYNSIGNTYRSQANYPQALKNHYASLKIRQEIEDQGGISTSYNNIGIVFEDQGNYAESLKNYFLALKIKEAIDDMGGVATALSNIGNIYFSQGNFTDALKNFFASLKIQEKINDENGIAIAYGNIGNVYYTKHNYPEALKNYFIALKIMEKIGDTESLAFVYTNIGAVYLNQGNYSEALKNQLASLKITEAIGDKLSMCASYNNIGSIYIQQKKYLEAEKYYKKATGLAKEIGYKELLKESYMGLMQIDSAKGNFKGAFQNYKMYDIYSDSLNNEDVRKHTIQNQMNYDFEKKEAVTDAEHKSELHNQNVVSEEKNRKQNIIIFSVISGLFLVAVFALIVFRALKITRRQKQIIEEQKFVVEKHKKIMEEKHKEITDSINYAERIQRSFLATEKQLNENLTNYFVLFKPKDVVSGDFYWSAKLSNNNFALAVADSTGHGVPGAIMSLLNVTSLEKAIEHHTDPSEILNHTRQTIIERLKKDGSVDGGKDGMDCSLLVFNFTNKQLQIAAANNPVWIIRENQLIEIKADKMPLGKGDRQQESFTLHTIELQPGDTIYTLTDGFPDQFGGPNGKKFMSKKLKELLLANVHLPIPQQKELLETTFKNWVGDLEQVDDICVVGIRV
jgi:serine phosphatase RsbU (regulator of sigma subunit)/Tfp pilus assembly protein PilF